MAQAFLNQLEHLELSGGRLPPEYGFVDWHTRLPHDDLPTLTLRCAAQARARTMHVESTQAVGAFPITGIQVTEHTGLRGRELRSGSKPARKKSKGAPLVTASQTAMASTVSQIVSSSESSDLTDEAAEGSITGPGG